MQITFKDKARADEKEKMSIIKSKKINFEIEQFFKNY